MGSKPNPYDPIFLQCFDTVGWIFSPVKPVPDMTYNVPYKWALQMSAVGVD